MRVVDSKRNDPYLANGVKRELLIRFWYPTSTGQRCRLAEYASPKTWAYISHLTGIQLPDIKTNSCLDAPIADGVHPVVVFTHGYTGMLTDCTFLFEDLASRGYVVIAVAHSYETTAVEFPDGRLVKSVFGSYLAGDSLRADDESLSLVRSVRLGDLRFVLDELERLNSRSDSPLAGKLDMSRIGLMGYSLGGGAALSSVEREARFKAAVIIDGEVLDASLAGTDKPVLILAAGRDQWSEHECRLWDKLRGPRFALNFKGGEHLTPSDAVWLATDVPELAVRTGTMGPDKTVAAIRNYIAVFFDTNLLGVRQSFLMNGPSSEYTDAAVTTQKQPLCGHSIKLN